MSRLLLSRPVPLYKVKLVVPLSKTNQLLERLSFFQDVHIDKIEEKEAEEIRSKMEETKRLLDIAKYVLGKSGERSVEAKLSYMELTSFTIEKIREDLENLHRKIISIESKLADIDNRRKKLSELYRYIKDLPDGLSASLISYRGKVYSSLLIAGKREAVSSALESLGERRVMGILLKEDGDSSIYSIIFPTEIEGQVKGIIEASGIYHTPNELRETINEFSTIADLKRFINSEIEKMGKTIESYIQDIRDLSRENIEWLGKYYLFLDNYYAQLSELQKVLTLKHLSVLSGWVPKGKINDLKKELNDMGIPHYLTFEEPSKDERPPSKLFNVKVIKNYELITELYGTPNYWEWDPTPLVAYSFAFFYGLMVGDIAYSALGILLIVFFLDKMVGDRESLAYRKFKNILIVSNLSALLFGVLTGTFLGNFLSEYFGITIPSMLSFMLSPIEFIKFSLIVGLVHINIAHFLALIKGVKSKDSALVLQELGIFGAQIFGIPLILKQFFDYTLPVLGALGNNYLLMGSLLSVLLIIISSVKTMRFLGFMTWIFQLTGVLGDVLSYVRLAGVGLATFYIAFSFNFIIKMLMSWSLSTGNLIAIVLGGLAAVSLLAITHLISLVLSILGGFVHSLRLCFLEFLSKFYGGDGTPFSPLRVALSRKIIIG